MELADALKVLAAARHFDDLDLALRYVGCARSEEALDIVLPIDEGLAESSLATVSGDVEDEMPRHRATDGWSLLTQAQLDEVAWDADTAPRDRPGVRRRPAQSSGRDTDSRSYLIPMLLEPDEQQPEPVPAYTSVAPPWPPPRSRVSAAHSAINPRTARATMQAVFKRRTESSEIDVDELVRRLSLALPITDTPRRQRDLTSPPMHLLYDTSLLIGPYAHDTRQLVRLARTLFDADALTIRAYRNTLRGGCGGGPVWTWEPFRFPPRPATIVFISGSFGGDLEIKARELEEIVGELERKGHRARVLWLGNAPPKGGGSLRSWRVIRG